MPEHRVLLVDDFQPWLSYVSWRLQEEPALKVVGEVRDGIEAIRRAEELNPDLILLDIGLPGMNGIEAARRILDRLPELKILFASEHRSAEIVQAALRTGARGYLVKSHAGTELLPAVRAILRGERFVGSCVDLSLDGHPPD